MKRHLLVFVALLGILGMNACSDMEGIDLDFHDPQHIQWVEKVIDDELLEAFGEENIHFGHTPPNLEGISFIVDQLLYDTCVRYRPVTINGVTEIKPSFNNPGLENSVYKHHFFDHTENVTHSRMYVEDHSYGNNSLADCDTAFITGSGNDFTIYFVEHIVSEQGGNPTWAYIISGTLKQDNTGMTGISNYRIGKKILEIEFRPTAGYYPGTYMILHPHTANPDILPYEAWDTIPTQGRNNLSF